MPRRLHCVTLLERVQYNTTQGENTGILQQQNTWTWKPPVVCSNQALPLSAAPLIPGLSTAVRLAWGHTRAGGENPIPSYYMYLVHVIPCMLSLTLVNFKPHPPPPPYPYVSVVGNTGLVRSLKITYVRTYNLPPINRRDCPSSIPCDVLKRRAPSPCAARKSRVEDRDAAVT